MINSNYCQEIWDKWQSVYNYSRHIKTSSTSCGCEHYMLPSVHVDRIIQNTPTRKPSSEFRTIKGIVSSPGVGRLIGANIKITGTNYGTSTNINGEFELKIPTGTKEITVSYVGYGTKTMYVRSGTFFNVSLDNYTRNNKKNFFGIRMAGVYSAPIINDKLRTPQSFSFTKEEYELAGSWEAGLTYRIGLFEIGVQYAERKHYLQNQDFFITSTGLEIERTIDERSRLRYLQLPLSFHIPLGRRFTVHLGGYGGYLLAGNGVMEVSDHIVNVVGDPVVFEQTWNIDYSDPGATTGYTYGEEPLSDYEYGALAGFEYYFKNRYRRGINTSLGLRYYHGLHNINIENNWPDSHSKSDLRLNQGSGSLFLSFQF